MMCGYADGIALLFLGDAYNDAKVFTAAKFTVLMIPSRHYDLLSRKRILIIDSMQEIILKRVIEENDCTYRKWIGA